MLERCRPLHAFDLGRLAGRGIVVRLARARREDGDARRRRARAHRRRPAHLRRRACRAGHRRDHGRRGRRGVRRHDRRSSSSRRTSRRRGSPRRRSGSGLRSEASARFERGVDPNDVAAGAARAMELLADGRGGAGAQPGAIDVYPKPIERARIDRAHRRGSTSCSRRTLSDAEVAALLTPLGIEVDGRHRDRAHVASRHRTRDRPRRGGRAPHRAATGSARTVPSNPEKIGALTHGATRAPRWSATCWSAPATTRCTRCRCSRPPTSRAPASSTDALIEVENPLRAEESVLRPGAAARACCARSRTTPRTATPTSSLFELGHVFAPPAPGETLPVERLHLAIGPLGQDRAHALRARPRRDRARPDRGRRGARAGAAARRLAAGRGVAARVPSGARGARSSSTAPRSARSARSTPTWSTRSRCPARSSPARSTSTRCSRRLAYPASGASGLALSRVGHRPRVRRLRRRARPATCCGRCAQAGGELLESVRALRRVPLRGARARAG